LKKVTIELSSLDLCTLMVAILNAYQTSGTMDMYNTRAKNLLMDFLKARNVELKITDNLHS
jgi:hypothetical protein